MSRLVTRPHKQKNTSFDSALGQRLDSDLTCRRDPIGTSIVPSKALRHDDIPLRVPPPLSLPNLSTGPLLQQVPWGTSIDRLGRGWPFFILLH